MTFSNDLWLRLAVALGIGLLIGVERERRKGEGPSRAPAGIRTFSLTAVLGAVSYYLGEALLLAVAVGAVALIAIIGYQQSRGDDPGLTSEISMLLTLALGALAMKEPMLASSMGVIVALLLAARGRIHHFVSSVLTEAELHDALVLAAAALVVMPLMPDRHMGPFDAINPHALWTVVVLMLTISAAGHVALRVFGARYGLAVAGLIAGFVSSAVTVSAMGARAKQKPDLLPAAVAGAIFSTLATMVLMVAVLGVASTETLGAMAVSLACGGLMALLYSIGFLLRSIRHEVDENVSEDSTFSFGTALALGGTLAVVLLGAAALNAWLGTAGVVAAAAIAGFADTHSPAISAASLVAGGKLQAAEAVVPILVAMTTNTITKIVLAITSGGGRYAMQVIPGLLLIIVAAWFGAIFAGR